MGGEIAYDIVSAKASDGSSVATDLFDLTAGKFSTTNGYSSTKDVTVTLKASVGHNFGLAHESSAIFTITVPKNN